MIRLDDFQSSLLLELHCYSITILSAKFALKLDVVPIVPLVIQFRVTREPLFPSSFYRSVASSYRNGDLASLR
jgi:hypothetical protein